MTQDVTYKLNYLRLPRSMALTSTCFVIPVEVQDGRPQLQVSVKRYTQSSPQRSRPGLTLVLTHGVTFREPPSPPLGLLH
jgi:hypothetical protein